MLGDIMTDHVFRALLLASLLVAVPAFAQVQRPLPQEDQLAPRQMQPAPPRARAPSSAAAPSAMPPAATTAPAPKPAARVVACSGVFARASSHLKLAQVFDSRNVTFGEVAGPAGSTLMASIVYPTDPKRRLEVLWQNEAARMDTSLIVITGQSQWSGPKGLRLGLPLAALEKLNGKPFKLAGFDQQNGGVALDWQGGALATLPGGCNVGITFKPDPKAPPDAVAAVAGAEFMSSDPIVRAAKPAVSEIIFGYSQ
jgi:hypothetical protein